MQSRAAPLQPEVQRRHSRIHDIHIGGKPMADDFSRAGSADGINAAEEMDDNVTITLNLDDGTVLECAVITMYNAGGRQYIALLPLDENGENEDGEVYLYRYSGTKDGDPVLENIEDDDEYEIASDGFEEWLDSQEYDDLVYDEDLADEDN